MQISLGEIQLHLRGATGRLHGKHCVYPNQNNCVSRKVRPRPYMAKEPAALRDLRALTRFLWLAGAVGLKHQ